MEGSAVWQVTFTAGCDLKGRQLLADVRVLTVKQGSVEWQLLSLGMLNAVGS